MNIWKTMCARMCLDTCPNNCLGSISFRNKIGPLSNVVSWQCCAFLKNCFLTSFFIWDFSNSAPDIFRQYLFTSWNQNPILVKVKFLIRDTFFAIATLRSLIQINAFLNRDTCKNYGTEIPKAGQLLAPSTMNELIQILFP